MSSSLAGFTGRYATALYELADEAGRVDAVAADLKKIGAANFVGSYRLFVPADGSTAVEFVGQYRLAPHHTECSAKFEMTEIHLLPVILIV